MNYANPQTWIANDNRPPFSHAIPGQSDTQPTNPQQSNADFLEEMYLRMKGDFTREMTQFQMQIQTQIQSQILALQSYQTNFPPLPPYQNQPAHASQQQVNFSY